MCIIVRAYTNRFMALANRVRTLKSQYLTTHSTQVMRQIQNLRQRLVKVL